MVARKPEIFVRELTAQETHRLVKVARTAKDRVRLRRAGMVLASRQGRSAPQIAVMFAAKEQTVRDVISAFNERGSRRWTQMHAVGRCRNRPNGA